MLTRTVLFTLACLISNLPRPASANTIEAFTMNTGPLSGDPAAPFSLDFQLNDGSGLGDGNNTAVLSDFAFGSSGGAAGSATLNGGASGGLGSSVTLTDTAFLNEFTQGFTPGDTLQFQLALTSNVDAGGVPDQFTFAILDNSGAQLPTLSFFDVFVEIDIDTANPAVQVFGSDPSRNTVAGGSPIELVAPDYASVNPIPEPRTALLVFAGFLMAWGQLLMAARDARNAGPWRRYSLRALIVAACRPAWRALRESIQ